MLRAVLSAALFAVSPLLHSDDIGLIRVAENWKWLKGTQAPPTNWNTLEFSDRLWAENMAGFSTPGSYGEATLLSGYNFDYHTVFFRKRFTVEHPEQIKELILRLDYDDGCVVYLNGREAARRGFAGPPGTPVPFTELASPHARAMVEEIDLTGSIDALRPGENVLAVQVGGSGPGDVSFVFVPELLANFTRTPYVQNTTTTSTKILWKTFSPADGLIEFGLDTGDIERLAVSTGQTNHTATLENLDPDTRYVYRVGSRSARGESWSDWSSFKTLKPSGSFSFAVIGDTGWASAQQYMIAEQMRKTEVDLIVHTGDLCYPAINERSADQRLLSVYARQMRTIPMFWVPGNHDGYYNLNVPLAVFDQPTNNVTGTEHYYSFDNGDAHFTVMWSDLQRNSQYQPGSPQYQWIEADLAASTKPWKFLFMHHCWRTSAIHQIDDYDFNGVRDMIQLDAVAELASRYGVQAFFNGHDHCYERFTPNRGIVSFLTGGGGAGLYGFYGKHPDTVQFFANYNFAQVSVTRDHLSVRAIDESGRLLDTAHLARVLPESAVYQATWHKPTIETAPSDDFDGNIQGQTFDLAGPPIAGKAGTNSVAGRLFVNNDQENIYVGLDNIMLHDGDEVLLFLEVPGIAAGTNATRFGPLPFTNFAPNIVAVLGNELADFSGMPPEGSKQGAMFLREPLAPIAGQKLQQFNRSPNVGPVLHENAANFVELALPLAALNLGPGEVVRIAAMVSLNAPGRPIDSGGIMTRDSGPIEVRLATNPSPDADGDGMTDPLELVAGTNPADARSNLNVSVDQTGSNAFELTWRAVPGKWYTIQALHPAELAFRDLLLPGFPRRAEQPQERVVLSSTNQYRFYRVAIHPN